ncbi:MAG: EF-P lysine aminoacylase GenX [Chlamydiia bacterium]|nr:EF-P lysine aminoacylase GenX [Chlamydiia bacterium]
MLASVRAFFAERNVLEVDTPLLSPYAPIDAHIDIFEVSLSENEKGFLHSSPEYGMKKVLAKEKRDIYQLGHVFRKGEKGALHAPEFTMIEWYRIETTFEHFLQENLALLSLFLGEKGYEVIPYQETFKNQVGLCFDTPKETLAARGKELGIELHDIDDVINLLWGCIVEPTLGQGKVTVITDFPQEQAALAQIKNGVAERFEFYFNGIELGNGYHELTDPKEQLERLNRSNQERLSLGKTSLPIDPELIKALESGLPDCYGIALGFDRLLMLKSGYSKIHCYYN